MGKLANILKAISFIPALVHGAEAVFGPGNGLSKKEKVQGAATMGLATAAGIDPTHADEYSALNNASGKLIDAVVDVLNIAKVFKKPSK